MRRGEIERIRGELDEFVGEVFGSLKRVDQRSKGGLYLRGLMLDGRRKSMQPMGERLGVDHQQLQQFVSSSPWPVEPVRRELAVRACEAIEPAAWVVDDTGVVKDGNSSPGVARQYSGTVGKVGNVQIGVSVHAVTDAASCPLGWRLFLPDKWDDTGTGDPADAAAIVARRTRAQIPEQMRHRPKWQLAVDMIDQLTGWGVAPPVLVADAGYGEVGPLRTALTSRGIPYVVQVKSSTSIHAADTPFGIAESSGRGRPRTKPRYQRAPVRAVEYAHDLPAGSFTEVSWRHGSKGQLTSRFAACRVRPANRALPRDDDGTLPQCCLLIEWPDDAETPTDYWLSTLPDDTEITDLVQLGKIRWRIEHDYRELKHGLGLGLDHFEGRTWLGWHHHVTLVTAAHLFITLQRLRADPKHTGQPDLLPTPRRAPSSHHPHAGPLPLLPPRRTHLTKYY